MSLFQQVKIFVSCVYLLLNNKNIDILIKYRFLFDFIRYSYRTFLVRRLGKVYSTERILDYIITVDYYPDFVSQFVEIFIHFIYYFDIPKKNISIIDCGSNIGVSVIFFKIFYPQSKILAFEPDPHAYSILKKNISQNRLAKIKSINSAIGLKQGKIYFYTQYENTQTRSVANSAINFAETTKKILVNVEKLDKFIDEKIDILKMDVEGIESQICLSLKNIRKVSNIAMEYHHYEHLQEKNKLSDILRVLEDNNFYYSVELAEGQRYSIKNHLMIVRAQRVNS